ncbi:MAG: hypothetical protein M2R45_01313 [Verrucomicrobia subdivision 3 bacterium]|nr:hypothetical protein [Limisphaerales bacterium]MCS1415179.1 hypothetical protein [Limisphaerales bacterium]
MLKSMSVELISLLTFSIIVKHVMGRSSIIKLIDLTHMSLPGLFITASPITIAWSISLAMIMCCISWLAVGCQVVLTKPSIIVVLSFSKTVRGMITIVSAV